MLTLCSGVIATNGGERHKNLLRVAEIDLWGNCFVVRCRLADTIILLFSSVVQPSSGDVGVITVLFNWMKSGRRITGRVSVPQFRPHPRGAGAIGLSVILRHMLPKMPWSLPSFYRLLCSSTQPRLTSSVSSASFCRFGSFTHLQEKARQLRSPPSCGGDILC